MTTLLAACPPVGASRRGRLAGRWGSQTGCEPRFIRLMEQEQTDIDRMLGHNPAWPMR
jgi:hypothetical protein